MKKYYLVPAEFIDTNFPDDVNEFQVVHLERSDKDAIYERMGQYLSEDESNYDKVIYALRRKLFKEPDELIDYVEIDKGDENEVQMEFIDVWEKVQNQFTVAEFCELVGINK